MDVGPRFRLSFFARQQQCKIYRILRQSVPIVSRFIKWNLKRPHCERQLNPQWYTGAEERKPRSWKRKQFVKYCFRRWQTTRIRDPSISSYSRKCLNFVLNIINYETYDNNSLSDSLRIIFEIRGNKTGKGKETYEEGRKFEKGMKNDRIKFVKKAVIVLKDILKD